MKPSPEEWGAKRIDELETEVERLRGELTRAARFAAHEDACRNRLLAAETTIATLREHLKDNHDIAVLSFSRAGVRHDKETCSTCKVLNGQGEEDSTG